MPEKVEGGRGCQAERQDESLPRGQAGSYSRGGSGDLGTASSCPPRPRAAACASFIGPSGFWSSRSSWRVCLVWALALELNRPARGARLDPELGSGAAGAGGDRRLHPVRDGGSGAARQFLPPRPFRAPAASSRSAEGNAAPVRAGARAPGLRQKLHPRPKRQGGRAGSSSANEREKLKTDLDGASVRDGKSQPFDEEAFPSRRSCGLTSARSTSGWASGERASWRSGEYLGVQFWLRSLWRWRFARSWWRLSRSRAAR